MEAFVVTTATHGGNVKANTLRPCGVRQRASTDIMPMRYQVVTLAGGAYSFDPDVTTTDKMADTPTIFVFRSNLAGRHGKSAALTR
jgi:hypothetical protein